MNHEIMSTKTHRQLDTTHVELSPLQDQATRLAQELDGLEKTVVALWTKLNPFLRHQEFPKGKTEELVGIDQHSSMWYELNNTINRVEHNRIILSELIEMIET